MGNTLKNCLTIGAIGLAAAGLTVLLGGCGKPTTAPAPQARAQQVENLARNINRIDVIRKLTHKYVQELRETKTNEGVGQAEYERLGFALEINDSLQAAGYIGLVQINGAYVHQPNIDGAQLLDQDYGFAEDYFYLTTSLLPVKKLPDIRTQLGPRP